MKQKSIYIWNLIGFLFTWVLGTLLHFANDWFSNPFLNIIAPVNESTWEHLKLLFFPMLFYGILEFFCYGRQLAGFLSIRIWSILLGMVTIVTLFYTYTGVLGFHTLALDIAVFVLGVAAAYWYSVRRFIDSLPAAGEFSFAQKKPDGFLYHPACTFISVILLLALLVCFLVFTFYPPHIGLFYDPSLGGYGLAAH